MAIFGTLAKWALGGYGDKPEVPQYVPVDPTKEQAAAIAGNLENAPQAEALASRTNLFNFEQRQKMLQGAIPGYQNLMEQASKNLQAGLRGEIPQDVANAIQNQAAARAIGGGYGGSGLHGNLVARDFGMTSYGITQQSLDSASRWMAMSSQMAVPEQMSSASMYLTPQQRIAYQFQNKENKFQRDWLASQIAAMPDPAMAAIGDALIQDLGQLESSLVGLAGGFATGGMGGLTSFANSATQSSPSSIKSFVDPGGELDI